MKVKPGKDAAGVKAGMRNRLAVRNDVDGIENPVAGVVVQQIETRSPKFRSKAQVGSDATAVEGVERKLRTFRNGSLPPVVDTGEICVRFDDGMPREEVVKRLAEVGATIVRPLGNYAPNGYLAVVDNNGDAIAAANALYGKAGVLYSHPNLIQPKKKAFVPNDTLFGQQWHLKNTGSNGTSGGTAGEDIKAERAWEITRGSSSVIVAVLDDGFDIGHEEFASANKIAPGYDFLSNDANPRPAKASDNHGTACAGLAVADGNNGKGVSGVAPGCRLMPIRMLGDQTDDAEAAAFNHAKNNGAHILSCSYNYTLDDNTFRPISDTISNAIDDAATNGRGGKGCVIVFAAGNDNNNADLSGYNVHPKVITVAASTNQGVKSSYSNFGPSIDVAAPGGPLQGDMMTVDRTGSSGYSTNNYAPSFNGTSAATPVVAGVAALLLSKEPNLTRAQVRQRLIDSSDFIGGVTYDSNGHHDWYGYGRVNAWRALTWNDNSTPTISIRLPGNGLTTSNLAAADGTIADTGTGVYQVMVAISDSQNRWWNWSSNGWSAPNTYIGSLDYHLKLATISGGTWSIALPNLGSGNYRIHAKAIDHADHNSEFSFSDFVIDPSGPQVVITTPAENVNYATPPTAEGTAMDNIQEKRFALFRSSDGRWFNWIAGNFDNATFVWADHVSIQTSSAASWTLGLPALDAGRYELHAMATDQLGRASDWKRRIFRINAPPEVFVQTPQHGTGIQDLVSIGGTVTDPSGAGLQNNRVSFTLYNDGSYWNGSAWTTTQTTLHATVSGGSWSYTSVPGGSDEKSGIYHVSAFAIDATGATSASVPGGNQTSFRLDREPPNVAITSPAHGSTLTTGTYQFRGTASDVGGIQAVNAFIRRTSDQAYWNGSGWGSAPIVLASTYNSNTGEWSVNSGLPILRGSGDTQLPNGNYAFIAIAIDNAGNFLQTDSAVTVDYHQIFNWTAGSYSDLDPNNNNLNWGNPANWSPIGVPAFEDIVYIDRNEAVYSTVSRTVHGFHMSTGAVYFTNGPDSLTIRKNGSWTGGGLYNSVYIESAASFALSGNATKGLAGGGVIHNSGNVTWTGPGLLQGNSGSIWNNKPGSSFTMLTDGDLFSNYNSGNTFNNEAGATFVKSAGSGELIIDEWTFNNSGTIHSQQGVTRFNTALNLSTGSSFAGAGRILLNSATTLTGALTSTGNPELVGGYLSATAGTFSGTNPFVWSRGEMYGAFTLLAGSVLDMTTGDTKFMGGGAIFNNLGRVNWQAGLLQGNSGSVFNNESGGIFDMKTDGDVFSNYNSGNTFNNKAGGLFIKSGKSAAPGGETFLDEWTFNNRGTVRSDTGVIRFHTVLNLFGGGTITRNGSVAAKIRSTHYFVLTGTTVVSNITFEAAGDWHGNLDAGTAGNGTIATQSGGVFEWTSGTAHNTVNIAAGSTFAISGPGVKWIGGGGILNNSGNATWTETGALQGWGGSTFVNLSGATFTAASDADWINYNSGNRFSNRAGAIFSKTAGTENNRSDWAFDNDGQLTVSSGALAMNSGGSSSGTFTATGTGLVQFTGGTHSLVTTAKFEGTGKTQFLGGAAVAMNSINLGSTATTLEIAGGTVTSETAASFNAIGTVNWTSGTIGGTFNLTAGSSMNLSGSATKLLAGGSAIHNSGNVTWTGPGLLQGNSGSIWNNKPGSSFTLLTDGDVFSNNNSGNTFNNEAGASFVKSAGAGEGIIDEWTINNGGTIQSQQGGVRFNTALNLSSGSSFAGAGRILLNSATTLTGALTSTGNPELVGGYLFATAGTFSGTNPFVWSRGEMYGVFTLLAGSVLDMTTGDTKFMGGGTIFNNLGRVNWQAGLLQGNSGTVFNNESGGIFDMKTDGDVFSNYNSGNTFNNKAGGLFIKSGRSAAPDGETFLDEWIFNNRGTIRSDTGVMRFHLPLNLYGGGTITRSGSVAAKVRYTHYSVLTGTTTVSNITFEAAGDWHGNLDAGTAGNGTIATQSGGVFEWTAGTAHNTVNIAAGSTFSISGPDLKWIGGGGVLNNGGTATRTGTGSLQGWGGSTLVNLPGAVFNVATSAPFTNYNGGNRFTNSGTLNIGSPLGISPLHWSFTQSATGRLNIDIGGTNGAAPDFDQFNISGDASLSGTLGVSLVNGYTPLAGVTFPVVTFGARSGSFDSVLSPGAIWGRQYNPNSLSLVAKLHPTTRGEWVSYYFTDAGSPDALLSADPDRDGIPNLLEYALGWNPLVAGNSGITAGKITIGSDTYLTLTFTRPAGDAALTDAAYIGERSGNMTAASWLSSGVVEHSVVPIPGQAKETVTLRSTQPISGAPKDFLHLKVVVTPLN